MKKDQKKTIIILGMHRSGTSLVSGIMTKLGVNMGDELFPKDPYNPLGHFEDVEFLKLNERILESAGGHCNEPPKYDIIIAQKQKFDEEIKNLVQRKDEREFWGWKEPRTSLTIDLYLPYISNPVFLFCKRDAAGVAESMHNRQEFPIDKGKLLKELYDTFVVETCNRFPEIPVLEIYFEELLNKPEYWIRKVISFTQLQISSKQLKNAVSFVSSKDDLIKRSNRIKSKTIIINYFRHLLHRIKMFFSKKINNLL